MGKGKPVRVDGHVVSFVYLDGLGDPEYPWVVTGTTGKQIGKYPNRRAAFDAAPDLGVKAERDRAKRVNSLRAVKASTRRPRFSPAAPALTQQSINAPRF